MGIGSLRTPVALIFAASTMVIVGFGQGAEAATVSISGQSWATAGITAPTFGTTSPNNNVANYAPSGSPIPSGYTGLQDTGQTTANAHWVLGSVSSTVPNYSVTWYFLGLEAANANTLTISVPTTTFGPVGNTNENCSTCGSSSNYNSLTPFATSNGTAAGVISAIFKDTTTNTSFVNGTTLTALMLAYVNPTYVGGVLKGWTVSTIPTDWFAIGFNDNGSRDGDYDDLMVVGHVSAVPLPAALPLFATGLAALGLLGWRRKRKAQAAA